MPSTFHPTAAIVEAPLAGIIASTLGLAVLLLLVAGGVAFVLHGELRSGAGGPVIAFQRGACREILAQRMTTLTQVLLPAYVVLRVSRELWLMIEPFRGEITDDITRSVLRGHQAPSRTSRLERLLGTFADDEPRPKPGDITIDIRPDGDLYGHDFAVDVGQRAVPRRRDSTVSPRKAPVVGAPTPVMSPRTGVPR